MKILITGGAGFIGSNFTKYCINEGYEVTVLDNLTYAGGIDSLEPVISQINFIKGDICNKSDVTRAMQKVDLIVNFAAESHNTRSEKDKELFYKTNFEGLKNLIEIARKHSIKKFIQISTDEVYGPIDHGDFKETDKLKGTSQATSDYSKSKSLADDYAIEQGKNGFPIIVTRCTNNLGPYQHPEKLIPRLITNCLLGRDLPIWGKGKQIRDWIDVDDHCRAVDFLLKNGANGEAYNIASNNFPEIENVDVAKLICAYFELDHRKVIRYIPNPRPNHDFRYRVNTQNIENLGFKIQTPFKQSLYRTIDWYKNNSEWWKIRKLEAERIYTS